MVTARLLQDVAHGFTGIAAGDLRLFGTGGGPPPPVTPTPAATDRLVARLGGHGPLVVVRQVHGKTVVNARSVAADTDADAILSTTPGQVVAVRVADCVPVLLAAPGGVAAVHAGWRGTAAGITAASVRALCSATGALPAQIRAAVGPSICPDCYEVGDDVVAGMRAVLPADTDDRLWLRAGAAGRPHVDVATVNVLVLEALGVAVERVGGCSRCGTDAGGAPLYWSHRRDPENGARQVGAIVCPPRPAPR